MVYGRNLMLLRRGILERDSGDGVKAIRQSLDVLCIPIGGSEVRLLARFSQVD